MKSLQEKRAVKKVSKNTDFFFVKSLHWKRSNKKELKKFAMNTILEDLTVFSPVRVQRGLTNIHLEIGDSLFEIKYTGAFGGTGNAIRVTTWKTGYKEWELEKETKANKEFLLVKSSGIIFIFYLNFT